MDSAMQTPNPSHPSPAPGAVEALIAQCRAQGMGQHPFLKRLSSEPVDLARLYDVLANLNVLTSAYVPWLAATIARVDNNQVRSVLAKILNDELGSGNVEQIHVSLFDKSLVVLQAFATPKFDATLSIGHEFRRRTGEIFNAADPLEGVGVVIAGEIFADQFIRWLGGEVERQSVVKPESLGWYTAHSELEPHHADDSSIIARLASTSLDAAASVRRGAELAIASQRAFLDALQRRYEPAQN